MTFGGSTDLWGKIGTLQQAEAERLVGQALKNLKVPRESVVVATKVFGETRPGPNAHGNTRSHILDGVKSSLKRLQLGHLDLYQVHGFDPATPIEETVCALDQRVLGGQVRHVGVSNWAACRPGTRAGCSSGRASSVASSCAPPGARLD